MRYIPIRMAHFLKILKISSSDEDVEKLKLLFIARGEAKYYCCMKKMGVIVFDNLIMKVTFYHFAKFCLLESSC